MTMYDHYLITGATGFLGKTLTERLIKSGARVTALVLADDPLRAELPAAVEAVFPLSNHAQILIVEQNHFDGNIFRDQRSKFLNIHLE